MEFIQKSGNQENSANQDITSNNFKNVSPPPTFVNSAGKRHLKNYHNLYPKEQKRLRKYVFQEYLKKKTADAENIPVRISRAGYGPDRNRICEEIDVDFGVKLSSTDFNQGWFSDKIEELVALQLKSEGKDNPTAEEKQRAITSEAKKNREFAAILGNWLKEIGKSGKKLKYGSGQNVVDYLWISEETNIPYHHLIKTTTSCHKIIKAAFREIGFETFPPIKNFTDEHTYNKLLEYGTNCRQAELEGKTNADSQRNYTRHALLKFLKCLKLTRDSKIGPEIGILFNECSQEFAMSISNNNTRRKLMSELRKWQNYYRAFLQIDYLPADLAGALTFLLGTSGTSYNELGKYLGTEGKFTSLVSRWASGKCVPLISHLEVIHKIEEFFNLPPETLASRIVFYPAPGLQALLRREGFPRARGVSYSKLASLLPDDFPTLSGEVQRRMVSDAVEYIIQSKSEYRRRLGRLTKDPYRLKIKNYPPRLLAEMEHLVYFKTAEIPPPGYRRHPDNKWKKTTAQRSGTTGFFYALTESVFGVLTAPKEKFGAGLNIGQLTITHLALPAVWRVFFDFMEDRTGKIPVSTVAHDLNMIYSWLNEEFGWLVQSPWLADALNPIPEILSEEDVGLAKTDWLAFIKKIKSDLKEIKDHIDKMEKTTPPDRDSHLPILPILESDAPLQILRNAIKEYELKIPHRSTAPVNAALGLRNVIFLRILAETALRSYNMLNLTWKPDNSGQLRKHQNGHYYIEISPDKFKNPQSSYFGPPKAKYNYKVNLSNKLTLLLDEYLLHERNYLLSRWAESKGISGEIYDEGFLFISESRALSQGMTYSMISYLMYTFTSAELVYNPLTGTGIKGVEPFCLHGVRHIVATHVLKVTGSFADAAAAIQDTAETVRIHYARYLPSDRDKRFRTLITDLMEDDSEEWKGSR